MPHPLAYDPVEASRERWVEQGWGDCAAGMAAVVSVMRAEQIFLNRATAILRPLELTFARFVADTINLNAIDRLEAAELCRRVSHPTDARATLVEITPKGRRLCDRAVERLNAELFGTVGLDATELDLLVGLIEKIRAAEGDVVAVDRAART